MPCVLLESVRSIARSLAFAPYADVLWMETKSPLLAEARQFAAGVHAVFPQAMLAYNLSPSFNWSAAGLGDDDIRRLQSELGSCGYWSHTPQHTSSDPVWTQNRTAARSTDAPLCSALLMSARVDPCNQPQLAVHHSRRVSRMHVTASAHRSPG